MKKTISEQVAVERFIKETLSTAPLRWPLVVAEIKKHCGASHLRTDPTSPPSAEFAIAVLALELQAVRTLFSPEQSSRLFNKVFQAIKQLKLNDYVLETVKVYHIAVEREVKNGNDADSIRTIPAILYDRLQCTATVELEGKRIKSPLALAALLSALDDGSSWWKRLAQNHIVLHDISERPAAPPQPDKAEQNPSLAKEVQPKFSLSIAKKVSLPKSLSARILALIASLILVIGSAYYINDFLNQKRLAEIILLLQEERLKLEQMEQKMDRLEKEIQSLRSKTDRLKIRVQDLESQYPAGAPYYLYKQYQETVDEHNWLAKDHNEKVVQYAQLVEEYLNRISQYNQRENQGLELAAKTKREWMGVPFAPRVLSSPFVDTEALPQK